MEYKCITIVFDSDKHKYTTRTYIYAKFTPHQSGNFAKIESEDFNVVINMDKVVLLEMEK